MVACYTERERERVRELEEGEQNTKIERERKED